MNEVWWPWDQLEAVIEPFILNQGMQKNLIRYQQMFRIHCMQNIGKHEWSADGGCLVWDHRPCRLFADLIIR